MHNPDLTQVYETSTHMQHIIMRKIAAPCHLTPSSESIEQLTFWVYPLSAVSC